MACTPLSVGQLAQRARPGLGPPGRAERARGKRLPLESAVVDEDNWTARRASFGAVAQSYAVHRPDYPQAAVRWALAPAGPDVTRLRVLDLGAGTGKLTAVL